MPIIKGTRAACQESGNSMWKREEESTNSVEGVQRWEKGDPFSCKEQSSQSYVRKKGPVESWLTTITGNSRHAVERVRGAAVLFTVATNIFLMLGPESLLTLRRTNGQIPEELALTLMLFFGFYSMLWIQEPESAHLSHAYCSAHFFCLRATCFSFSFRGT